MQLNLEGRVFVVTGAAQGIGAAIVCSLIAEGAAVAAIDIDPAGLLATHGATTAVRCYTGDLGSRDSALGLCAAVLRDYGHVDGLVAAAGGVRGQVGRPLDELTESAWRAIFAANVDAAMWCVQALTPSMQARGHGRVVTISSGAGLRPSLTGIQAYTAAKHALVGLTRQLAMELGPAGITVNSVAPGLVLSNPSTVKQWESFAPAQQEQIIAGLSLRRLGHAGDIADAVTFLCSDRAAWISGQVLPVDGGRL